ncbi:hypothetical protein GA0115234_112826 [Streptomyces sp. DvalAA-43]|nr:hypothetical protein GA0115234_112826 [Streptomyces sp. DvalAA-43]
MTQRLAGSRWYLARAPGVNTWRVQSMSGARSKDGGPQRRDRRRGRQLLEPAGVYQMESSGGGCLKAVAADDVRMMSCADNPGKPQRRKVNARASGQTTIKPGRQPGGPRCGRQASPSAGVAGPQFWITGGAFSFGGHQVTGSARNPPVTFSLAVSVLRVAWRRRGRRGGILARTVDRARRVRMAPRVRRPPVRAAGFPPTCRLLDERGLQRATVSGIAADAAVAAVQLDVTAVFGTEQFEVPDVGVCGQR